MSESHQLARGFFRLAKTTGLFTAGLCIVSYGAATFGAAAFDELGWNAEALAADARWTLKWGGIVGGGFTVLFAIIGLAVLAHGDEDHHR